MCKNSHYIVQILEKLDGNGRIARGVLDVSIIPKRKQTVKTMDGKVTEILLVQMHWWTGDAFIKEDTHVLVESKFPTSSRKSTRISESHDH